MANLIVALVIMVLAGSAAELVRLTCMRRLATPLRAVTEPVAVRPAEAEVVVS